MDGDIAYTIVTDAAVSTDGDYNSVNPADVEVTNTDDDGVGGGNNCFETDDTTARCDRPVPIGVSSGHPSITAGTIGMRVTDGTDVYALSNNHVYAATIGMRVTDGTDVYALSNNHVYAATNSATIGDKVLQPGTIDGGTDPADAIGTLDDFEPILFDGSDNIMDAAIALSSTANLGNSTPNNGYGVPSSATQVATVGLRVIKYGRTTEETKGKVYVIDATVNVCYEVTDARAQNRRGLWTRTSCWVGTSAPRATPDPSL